MPYEKLKDRTHGLDIKNRFIVYILHGKNTEGKDYLYVGKSKNGIDYRPTSHDDKYDEWDDCYVLTTFKEKTFLNDGNIQYIEDAIKTRIDSLGRYNNTTYNTNTGTANSTEVEDCEKYLEDIYNRLFVLGLDLLERNGPEDVEEHLPEGHLTENKNLFTVREKYVGLYNELVKKILELNSDIEVTAKKVYIKFTLGRKYLFTIDCANYGIIVYLCAKPGQIDDPKHVLTDVAGTGHHGLGDLKFVLNTSEQIPTVCDFVNQVINL